MKTWHWIVLVVGLAAVGFAVYWFGFHKRKSIVPPVTPQAPAQAQSSSQKILGFAENEGKKVLGDFINRFI
jgi:hypothetical protein